MPNSNRIRAQCVLSSVRRSGLVRRPAGDVASDRPAAERRIAWDGLVRATGRSLSTSGCRAGLVRVPAAGTGADLLFTAADTRNGGDAAIVVSVTVLPFALPPGVTAGEALAAMLRARDRGDRAVVEEFRTAAGHPAIGIRRIRPGTPRENGPPVGQHRAGAGACGLLRGRRARRRQRRLPQSAGPERDRRPGGRPGRQDAVTAAAPGLAAAAPVLADQVNEG